MRQRRKLIHQHVVGLRCNDDRTAPHRTGHRMDLFRDVCIPHCTALLRMTSSSFDGLPVPVRVPPVPVHSTSKTYECNLAVTYRYDSTGNRDAMKGCAARAAMRCADF